MEVNLLPETVICRPDKGCWAFVVIFGFVGLLMPLLALFAAPHDATMWCMVGLSFSAFGLPAVLFAIWIMRGYIIADEASLRWRGLGSWRTTSWNGIADYYEKPVISKNNTRWFAVDTESGILTLRDDFWSNTEAVCTVIAQRATAARVGKWGLLGTRPDQDWPSDFNYNTSDNRAGVYIFCAFILLLLFLFVGAIPKIASTFTQMGLAWGVASIGVLLLGIGPMALFAMLPFIQMQDNRKRRCQRITVRCEGIMYEDGASSINATWNEIEDYYFAPRKGFNLGVRSVVTTRNGTFDFTSAIGDIRVLRKIIADNAKAAKTTEWRSPEDDVLGGNASRWSSGCEGVGERIYHYRSRSLRAMLLFPTVLAFVPLLLVPLASMGLTPKPNWVPDTLFCGFALWGWWRYSVASIQVDATGITQQTIFGPRRLRWEQVERFYISGGDAFKFGNVVGTGTRIRFWIGIADVEEQKAEIARRAVNSRNRTWDEAETAGEPSVVKGQ